MDKILIGTKNLGKFKEFSEILNEFGIATQSIAGYNIKEPEETGASFLDNANLKSKYYGDIIQMRVLADDSGICVEELGGWPGIYSSRIADGKNFTSASMKIKKKLEEVGKTISNAYFYCVLSLYNPSNGSFYNFDGRIDGYLDFTKLDDKKFGFDYDPIFVPHNYKETFAQMDSNKKNAISHRKIAIDKLAKFLTKELK